MFNNELINGYQMNQMLCLQDDFPNFYSDYYGTIVKLERFWQYWELQLKILKAFNDKR